MIQLAGLEIIASGSRAYRYSTTLSVCITDLLHVASVDQQFPALLSDTLYLYGEEAYVSVPTPRNSL